MTVTQSKKAATESRDPLRRGRLFNAAAYPPTRGCAPQVVKRRGQRSLSRVVARLRAGDLDFPRQTFMLETEFVRQAVQEDALPAVFEVPGAKKPSQ